MGSGILDYVTGSIVLFNACYFLNRLVGHDIKIPFKMKLDFKEMEQLSITSVQRFLRLEKERFEKSIPKELQKQPLYRRLKKKAEENVEYLKKTIKEIESKV